MTVDKNIMEFEKKGLGNSEKVMDFLALGGVQTPTGTAMSGCSS
jgi:hypothetical protein